MQSKAATVDEYLAELPPERREAIAAVRAKVLARLPEGYDEGMLYGMVSWHVPLERYPDTYNGQPLSVASLASRKLQNLSMEINSRQDTQASVQLAL